MNKTIIAVLLVAGFLVACASKPLITDLDVATYQDKGELLSLYEALQGEIKTLKPESELAENRQLYITRVGRLIAEQKEQKILDDLDREFGKHSIATLRTAQGKAADIRQYDDKVYTGLIQQLEQAISQKKGVILSKEAEYYELDDKDALRKVQKLDEIVTIYGEGKDATQILSQRKAYVDGLFANAQQALVDKDYEKASRLLKDVGKIEPEYQGLQNVHEELKAAEYEQQFWDALEKGQTDLAYGTFYKLSMMKDYIQTHADIVPIADDMAQFFIAEGDQWIKDKSVNSAYQSYSRARYIKTVIGKANVYSPGEKKFIELIDKRMGAYVSESLNIPAYGTLLVLQELMPEHESVQKFSQQLSDAVLNYATFKILTKDFSGQDNSRQLGIDIAARINNLLLKALPGQVQLIGPDIAATKYLPHQIVSMPNASSYYVLSGDVLEAVVSRKEEASAVTRRELISLVKEENPEYKVWLDLSKRKQKELPQPPEFIDKPVEEDVVITKNLIEQGGLVSVAYRLADAVSASVLFSDTQVEKEKFVTESIPAVKVGLFEQQEKPAELRSDDEILDLLSTRLAEVAAGKIVQQIVKLQMRYLQKADQAVVLEDFNAAAEYYAYSHVLAKTRGEADDEVLVKLRTYALRWQ